MNYLAVFKNCTALGFSILSILNILSLFCINLSYHCTFNYLVTYLKRIVSRDFGGLQMILMNRTWGPDVPLEVYSFFNFRFHIVI